MDASEDPRAELERMLEAALADGLIQDAAIAANEAQAEAFWRLRDSISEAERASGFSVAHDISVAVADMPRFMVAAAAEVESAFPGAKASAFGHLGDGNVHFHVRLESGQSREGFGDHPAGARPRHRRRRLDFGRAWDRPDEARRA